MYLIQMAQAPFTFRTADENGDPQYEIVVPKYTLRNTVAWGQILADRWADKATEGLDPVRKNEHLSLYPAQPPTLGDMRRHLATPEGSIEVIEASIPLAKVFSLKMREHITKEKTIRTYVRDKDVTSEELLGTIKRKFVEGVATGAAITVAWEIADLKDISQITPPSIPKPGNNDDEVPQSPLTVTGKTGSTR